MSYSDQSAAVAAIAAGPTQAVPPPVPGSLPNPTGPSISPLEEHLIGGILRAQTALTEAQVLEALDEQRREPRKEGGRLGEILARKGFVTEEQVVQALAKQLGVNALAELKADEIDTALVLAVPINFAKAHKLLPIKSLGSSILVAMADPLDVNAIDDLSRVLGAEIEPAIMTSAKIFEAINKVYSNATTDEDLQDQEGADDVEEESDEELVDILDATDEAPIIRWVNSLMFQAVKERASDIHIEPHEKDLMVRYRIDGSLKEHKRAKSTFTNQIIARVKIMSGLNIAEKRLPQDGRIRRKIAGKDIDMRVATAPTPHGERITIRLLDRSSVLLDLQDIGFPEDTLAQIDEIIHRPHGILLVTGPTGSGKTTTLYSCLSKINTPDLNILTVEDPVEYQLEGISQIQVNPKIELTFASAIRSFLRHDPDVIMVGEVRDPETAAMAITASLTGHLVFSTIHTNDAAGAITRLVDMGIEPFLVASSLVGLLAQRLVRRVCPDCRVLHKPTPEDLAQVGIDAADFFAGRCPPTGLRVKYPMPPVGMVYAASKDGCQRCSKAGYTGRSGIYELLMMDDELRQLALKNTDAGRIKQAAIAKGMRTLRDDGARKVLVGITTIEEVLLVTTQDTE